ncbi:hypothetical protein NVP1084O_147 [Vibrio phage 1.084.O._10N.261.49.F5]|nr:hypothetical protein NVP1084O_147 [Vibrio phage 1.084.O._10N.261.49.F5]
MKKNKLIELLNNIEGNPDIYLWNGYVEDWVDLDKDFVPLQLVHKRKSHIRDQIHFDMLRTECEKLGISYDEKDKVETPEFFERVDKVTDKAYKEHHSGWYNPNPFVEEDRFKEWYDKTKTVYVINSKVKGESCPMIRGGSIEY